MARLKQKCGAEDCPAGCGPSIGIITCVSLIGSCTLYGWHKFIAENEGDWNMRVFKRLTASGQSRYCAFEGTTCSDWSHGATLLQDSECTLSPATGAQTNQLNQRFYEYNDGDGCCGCTSGASSPSGACGSYFLHCPVESVESIIRAATSASLYMDCVGCSVVTPTPPTPVFSEFAINDISWSLSDPLILAEAFASNGAFTAGTNCRTNAGTIGEAAQSLTRITGGTNVLVESSGLSVSATQLVTATIPCSGLTAATDYVVTVRIARYMAGGGALVDFVLDTIEFTASGPTEEVEYELPVNTDYDYEIDISYKDIVVA